MAKKDFKIAVGVSPAKERLIQDKPVVQELDAVPEGYKLNPLYIEKKTKRVQLLLQPSVVASAKETAVSKGISFNELVNIALKAYLESEA